MLYLSAIMVNLSVITVNKSECIQLAKRVCVCRLWLSSAESIQDVQRACQRRLRHSRQHGRRQVLRQSVLRQRLRHSQVVDSRQRHTHDRFARERHSL